MTVTVERLDAIVDLATRLFAGGADRDAVVKAVKQDCAGLTVTGCSEDDMSAPPYREARHFQMFLVDNTNHCWTLTTDPAQASGIVIAQREEEDA